MLAVLGVVGASAGLALYTKRTESMIRQFHRVSERQAMRAPKKKPGPMTKAEWDKVRPRIDKDDFV